MLSSFSLLTSCPSYWPPKQPSRERLYESQKSEVFLPNVQVYADLAHRDYEQQIFHNFIGVIWLQQLGQFRAFSNLKRK